jgi:flagellar export protein FliJ
MKEELQRKIKFRERKKAEYAEQMMRGELSVTASMNANNYIKRLREEEIAFENLIEEQKAVVAEHEGIVAEKRELMIEAHKQLKALEKHKEKFLEQAKKELQAKEEDALDEIAQTIFQRSGGGG